MITHKIKYGGELNVGDFIGVGHNYGMDFGWYSGNGRAGNVQYISARNIKYEFNAFRQRMENIVANNLPMKPLDRRGFSLDHIGKIPVKQNKNWTMVKITCPDDVFIGDDLKEYLEAKRILTDMKFLKH